MRIGEVADRTGVANRMLRYYEEQELLTPGRHRNGYRDYTESDVRRVETIRDLSASGVPTRFIKIVLDRQADAGAWTSKCDAILADMVRCQIAELDSKISCLTTSREALRSFLDEATLERTVRASAG
ncbi:MerR family transcriptional regulator [Labedaea rhizosphaerae]|uniref:DNA-binding transcriptional MerR regulator n=1 Tax=Labedaea rhizosphaerae TaxID=598644 RepID=A0A4R6SBP6_LABRH|nr:MerR family transcriptional regulator [Labedaea rhizosphaerae]TDP96436.1 DNA-binding transcriptional MerR regulator [Labedaea rhizosphaerae]